MSDVDLDRIFEPREPVKKPGWRKALPWVLAVLIVGIAIGVLFWKFSNTGSSYETPFSNAPAKDVSATPPTVKLAPGAQKTARRFIETAVARKNLREAYFLSGPQIRQGMSLKEWMTGNIAVIPYPVSDVELAPMKVDFSYPREAQIEVALLPKKEAKARAQLFIVDLIKDEKGKWLVNAWVPRSSPPVPNGSVNNGAGQ